MTSAVASGVGAVIALGVGETARFRSTARPCRARAANARLVGRSRAAPDHRRYERPRETARRRRRGPRRRIRLVIEGLVAAVIVERAPAILVGDPAPAPRDCRPARRWAGPVGLARIDELLEHPA